MAVSSPSHSIPHLASFRDRLTFLLQPLHVVLLPPHGSSMKSANQSSIVKIAENAVQGQLVGVSWRVPRLQSAYTLRPSLWSI